MPVPSRCISLTLNVFSVSVTVSVRTIVSSAAYPLGKSFVLNWIVGVELDTGAPPPSKVKYFFDQSDALYLSLKNNDTFKKTIPGKLSTYMFSAKPIIASIDGEGARIINEANCGITSPAESVNDLVESIIKFNKLDDNQKKIMGNNAKSYFKKEFERNILLKKLIKFINDK